jgi:hypothetical protein
MLKPICFATLLAGCFTADIALAGTANINLPVTVKPGESYPGLLSRASKLAGETIDRRFQQSPDSDRVNLLVTAEKQGEVAPILSVNVSRRDWRNAPNIDRHAKISPFGKDLLGFGGSRPASSPVAPTPTAATAPPTATPTSTKKSPVLVPVPPEALQDPGEQRSLPDQRLKPAPTDSGGGNPNF